VKFFQPEVLGLFSEVRQDRVPDDEVEARILVGSRLPGIGQGETCSGDVLAAPFDILGIDIDSADLSISVLVQVPGEPSAAAPPVQNRFGLGNIY